MDARESRTLRRQLGALARPTIEFTRQQLADYPDLVALLDAALAGTPLPKPPDAPHAEPDYLVVGLNPAQLGAVVAALTQIEAARPEVGADEVHLSFAPTLVGVWSQLLQPPSKERE